MVINNNSVSGGKCNEYFAKGRAKKDLERILAVSSFSLSMDLVPQPKLFGLSQNLKEVFCM